MKYGLNLPQLAHFADPAITRRVARAAEEAGFSSLWVIDRLLAPVEPRSRYPGTDDGLLPPVQRHAVLDPLVTLAVAATVTERIRIGTSVLVAPWYPPALLARSLATLDRVASGRLDIGLGLGWSVDEFDAVGADMARRGARLEEVVEVMTALWRDDAVDIATSGERIAPATMGAKPVQTPHPPILLATYNPTGLDRVGRIGDGWLPAGLPFDIMGSMWGDILEAAERYGRDPSAMRLVVRADTKITTAPLDDPRAPFSGSMTQIGDDIARAAALGVHEIVLDLHASTGSAEQLLETAAALAAGVDAPAMA